MKRLPIILAFLLSSCAHVDTGQIDYRIAETPNRLTHRNLDTLEGNNCADVIKTPCDPLLPSRVVRRYMADPLKGWDAFKPGQIYSIDIEQGVIGSNILEGEVLGIEFGKTAEIAVLANVFEFASQATNAEKRRFLEATEIVGSESDPSDVELKLVYFGDDVRRKQGMNFSNISLQPRSAYGGGSIGIQLIVMEVDAQAGPVASLLKTLAKFGQQALPGPGEAKDMLYDLGESLLGGEQDDKLLEYRFVLSAGTEDARAVQATFAPGRYVVRRIQQRAEEMGWDQLRLDHNTGRLFRMKRTGSGREPTERGRAGAGLNADGAQSSTSNITGDFEEVRDDLYVVLNIKRYPDGTLPEFYEQKDWSAFRSTLQAAADAKAAPLDKLTNRLTTLLAEERSTSFLNGLKLSWATARNRWQLYASRYARDLESDPARNPAPDTTKFAECQVARGELQRRLNLAEREAIDATRIFLAEYREALGARHKDSTGNDVDEFGNADREALASQIARHFMPWSVSKADSASFTSALAFETAFIGTAVGAAPATDLVEVSRIAAESAAGTSQTCETLTAR